MRTRSSRNILALTVVALALCSDGTPAAVAGSTHKPHHDTLAGQIVRKLQVSFRRVVPQVQPPPVAVFKPAPAIATPLAADAGTRVAPLPLSPFQFRLPPPPLA